MICPNGHAVFQGAAFCPRCGAGLPVRRCHEGHEVEPGDLFCGECGSATTQLPADTEDPKSSPPTEPAPPTKTSSARSWSWIGFGVVAGAAAAFAVYSMIATPSEAADDAVASPTSIAATIPGTSPPATASPSTSQSPPEPTTPSSATTPTTTTPAAGCDIPVPPDEEPIVYHGDPVCVGAYGIVSKLDGNAERAIVYRRTGSGWQEASELPLSAVRLQYELEDLGMSTADAAELCRQWADSDYHCGLERPLEWLTPGRFGPDIVLGETAIATGIESLEESFGPVQYTTNCMNWVPSSGWNTVEVWAWDGFGVLSWPDQGGTIDGYHVLEPGLATEHGLQVGDSYLRIHHLVDYVDEWQWGELNVFTVGDPGAVSGEEYRGGVVSAAAKVGVVTQLSGGWDCYTPSH